MAAAPHGGYSREQIAAAPSDRSRVVVTDHLFPGTPVHYFDGRVWVPSKVVRCIYGCREHESCYELDKNPHASFDQICVECSQDPSIPLGWESVTSGAEGHKRKVYYFSRATGASTWQKPTMSPVEGVIKKLKDLSVVCELWERSRPPSDARRDQVRAGTMKYVCEKLKLAEFGAAPRLLPDHVKYTKLFRDAGDGQRGRCNPRAGGSYLLGRFDVCAVKGQADYDAKWSFKKGKNFFWCLHAAALNIGEQERAPDFQDYQYQDTRTASSDVHLDV
jgi:hypothetical protein